MVADPAEVAAAKAGLAMAERLSEVVLSHQRPLDKVAWSVTPSIGWR